MIYLNAGNLWTESYLNKVIELNKKHTDVHVESLFGSIAYLTPTARAFDRLPRPPSDFVKKYIKKAHDNNISIRYTLNQSCIGPIQDFKDYYDKELKAALYWLCDVGIREWTVTSPLLVELLRSIDPTCFIEVSTIAEVATPEESYRWVRLGADAVNVSTSINRDFKKLKYINEMIQVSVLCNEACLHRCPWRRECYNLSSHNSMRGEDLFGYYPFRRCNEVRLSYPEEWLRSRLVLPQWLPIYQEKAGISRFKVAYRTHPEEVAMPILEAYMELKFTGNLCDLWPTIAKLGNTPEPREVTYISCDELDSANFLSHWYSGDLCPNFTCGMDCDYCGRMYNLAVGSK